MVFLQYIINETYQFKLYDGCINEKIY